MTPLRPFFHREVPVGGNANTINVSKYNMKNVALNLKSFKSTHTANYKQVVEFAQNPAHTSAYYAMDGGQSGNLFSGHYFDLNRKHLDGELMKMIYNRDELRLLNHETLVIKQKKEQEKVAQEGSKDTKRYKIRGEDETEDL